VKRGCAAAALAAALLLRAGAAYAHTPVEGIGDFYAGLLHPLVVPEYLITLVGSGLLLGQQGAEAARLGLIAFGFTCASGMLLSDLVTLDGLLLHLLLGTALLIGGLLAAALELPRMAPVTIAALTALLIGIDSGRDLTGTVSDLVLLAGTAISASLVVFYLAAMALALDRPWQRVGIRIVGSWTAASALLVLVLRIAAVPPAGAG